MLVIVPLIFYTIFLQDLLRFKLEEQEPTIAAGWDYITTDYMKDNPDDGSMNRLKYCDHSAAYDSYTNKDYDCENATHHEAPAAHECWISPGAEQVRCSLNKNMGAKMMPSGAPYSEFMEWNRGGMGTCSATLGILNYFIINKFMRWNDSSRANMTMGGKGGGSKERLGTDGTASMENDADGRNAHADKSTVDIKDTWVLKEEKFAVLADPWALNHISSIDPDFEWSQEPGSVAGSDDNHPLLDRTNHFYRHFGLQKGIPEANDWHSEMSDFLHPDTKVDNKGDQLETAPVFYAPEKKRSNLSGYASGWKDERQQNTNRENKFPTAWGPL